MVRPERATPLPNRRMQMIPSRPMMVMGSKTRAIVIGKRDDAPTGMNIGDEGYIDGYVQGQDGMPYAVFVRFEDGKIELLLPEYLQAALDAPFSGLRPLAAEKEGSC